MQNYRLSNTVLGAMALSILIVGSLFFAEGRTVESIPTTTVTTTTAPSESVENESAPADFECLFVDHETFDNLLEAGVVIEFVNGAWLFDGQQVAHGTAEDEDFTACTAGRLAEVIATAQP